MEGLRGTAIRSAVRDPSCPQAPVLARARRLLALVRGCSCGWLRPESKPAILTQGSRRPGRRRCRFRAVPAVAEPAQLGAQPDQVLMGIWQATANQVRGLEPLLETAGPACQVSVFPELGC